MTGKAPTIAACFLAFSVLAHAAPTAAAGKPEAVVHFEKGVKLYKASDYVGAIVEFQAAYKAEPNFKVRYNIGMTLYNLHRYVEAQVELTAYLTEGGKDVPDDKRTEVQSLLFEIGSYIGTLLVTSDAEGAVLTLDGLKVGALPLPKPLPVDVGEHVVLVEAPGCLSSSQKVSVAGGEHVSVDLPLTPSSQGANTATPPTGAGTHPGAETTADIIAGGTCSTDAECVSKQSCHFGQCMSRQQWTNLSKRGKNLIVPGWVLLGAALPMNVLFMISTIIPNEWDYEEHAAGYWILHSVGLISAIASIPLLVLGYRYRKLSNEKLAQLDTLPVPWVAQIDGGIAMGIAATF